MFYLVQVGELELFVELLERGISKFDIEPRFSVTAGSDWDDVDVYVSPEDVRAAIAYVKQHHHDEVYM